MRVNADAMKEQAGKAHRLLAAMANEKRLMILCQLIEGERSVNDIAELLDARQSTISQHLALLRKDGFVQARRSRQPPGKGRVRRSSAFTTARSKQ